jgi:hypothetical protein
MGRVSSTNGAKRNAYRILVEKGEGNRPLARQRGKYVDNIKMDGVMWTGLIWALVNTVMNLRVP